MVIKIELLEKQKKCIKDSYDNIKNSLIKILPTETSVALMDKNAEYIDYAIELNKKIHQRVQEQKKEHNAYTFFDVSYMCLKLLKENSDIREEEKNRIKTIMFDEYVHVDGDNVKAEKVIRSVRRDISDEAYLDVYYATLSAEEDALQAIYNFLRVGFAVGSKVLEQYSNPHVMRMLELRRKVGNESHHFNEFARFQSLDRKVYVSHLEPKSDVVMLVGRH